MRLNAVMNMDCLEGMKKVKDNSVDLIVTDPPYLMNYQSNRRVKQKQFDKILNDKDANNIIEEAIKECYRILKNDSAIYMFCSWHHIDFFKIELEKYFTLKNIIVWNKNNHGSGDLKGAYAPKHEFILYAHKGRSLFREKRIPDVIDCAKISSTKLVHPTEKPIELLEIFIRNSSDENAIVFDPFSGSGNTGLASLKNKRRFFGFELDENYCNLANNRLSAINNDLQ